MLAQPHGLTERCWSMPPSDEIKKHVTDLTKELDSRLWYRVRQPPRRSESLDSIWSDARRTGSECDRGSWRDFRVFNKQRSGVFRCGARGDCTLRKHP